MERGGTQGDPVYPTIFNILRDALVRAVLMEFYGLQEEQYRFGSVTGEHNIVLYVDDSHVAGHNSIWIQTTLT